MILIVVSYGAACLGMDNNTEKYTVDECGAKMMVRRNATSVEYQSTNRFNGLNQRQKDEVAYLVQKLLEEKQIVEKTNQLQALVQKSGNEFTRELYQVKQQQKVYSQNIKKNKKKLRCCCFGGGDE